MRNITFENDHYYHIYNRGTDKRKIFDNKGDIWRFIKGILIFNRIKPSGSIRSKLNQGKINRDRSAVDYGELINLSGELVEIIAFCLNPNHFHLLVRQVSDDGVSKFIQKLSSGYTSFYNTKNKRNGVLFQGKFKAVQISSDKQLLYTSAYINVNDKIHDISEDDKDLVFSSFSEYLGENKVLNICKKDIVLDKFDNKEDYKEFVEGILENSKKIKKEKKMDERTDLHLEF